MQAQQPEEARAVLNAILKRSESDWVSPVSIAFIYSRLGDKENGLAWLEKGYEQRDPKMTFLGSDPQRGRLRDDPRYQDLVRRVGFVPAAQKDMSYWRRFLRYVGLGS